MRTAHLLLAAVAAAPLSVALVLPAAAQSAVCDAYSGGCPSPGQTSFPDGEGEGDGVATTGQGGAGTANGGAPGGGSARGTTLPFTGGETVLMALLGSGALAGGTALVLAGRRRTASA